MRKQLLLMSLSGVILSGCAAVGPEFTSPDVTVPLDSEFYDQNVTAESELYKPSEPAADWWTTLDDPTLNGLIEKALITNTDLRVALANVAVARAFLVEAETGLQPTVDLNGSMEATRSAGYQRGSNNQRQDDNIVTSASIGLNWELDIFGRVRRSIEAANASIEQSEALLDDVQRIVISDVASAYVDYRGAQQRRRVVEGNIKNQQDTLDLTVTMSEEGIVSELDTTRARAQLTATQSLMPSIMTDLTAARNRLATLAGTTAREIDQDLQSSEKLPNLPMFVAVGDPTSLIRRRPDIREAERGLAVLTAQIGVVTADLFPTVSFGANAGLASDKVADIFDSGAFNYAIGPGITWNLFNREATRARIRQSEATADAQLARYDRTVLTALEEINTALVRLAYERQRNEALDASVIASQEAVELVRVRYNAGAESFLSVLDAERTLLDAEQQLTDSDIALNQGLIGIYRALGGGWEH